MTNQQIAEIFEDIACLLELKNDNPFRIRAYRKAADKIRNLSTGLSKTAANDRLGRISGIGKDLAAKIKELLQTGNLEFYEALKKEIPHGLVEMLRIPELGPKTIRLIYDKLNVSNIDQLELNAAQGKLKALAGIKEKTERNILKGIHIVKSSYGKIPLSLAIQTANQIVNKLKNNKNIKFIAAAGSVRRRKETVKDIDILAASSKPEAVMDEFVKLTGITEVRSKGPTKTSVMLKQNIPVDLRIVKSDSFGAALVYFTGSKDFNICLRKYALRHGCKVNEYGVFRTNKNKKIAGKTEKEVFKIFNMQYIPPVLREGRGELKLSLQNKLSEPVRLTDIKGDLHVHSDYSDGINTLHQIAEAGKKAGYKYIAVCDHSQSLKVANGLSIERLIDKIDNIKRVNRKFKDFRLLAGTEVDILSDGSLDYPDEILKMLDMVVASIHTGFKQTKAQLTKRIISAVKNKYVHIIGHPTGKLSGVREPYELDFTQIMKACSDYNTALEINSYPQRLDLNEINCRLAKENRVKLALGTDSHAVKQLPAVQLGIYVAQRGWIEKDDILNTKDVKSLLKWTRGKGY